jgi:transketolase
MRTIPGMTILSPADDVEAKAAVEAAILHDGPVYLRINRNDLPTVTPENEPWKPGKVWTLKDGNDAVVFANGVMVSKALEAAETLGKEGISVKVVNVSTIKPMNADGVIEAAKGMKGIVTAEESNIVGGVGSAVLEALRRENHGPVEFVGVQDSFGVSAKNYDEILEKYGLTAAAVAQAVKNVTK